MAGDVTFDFETTTAVSDYDDDFDDAKSDTEGVLKQANSEIGRYLGKAFPRAKWAKQLKIEVSFDEFDSSNPSHANAYWNVKVKGPRKIVELIAQKNAKELDLSDQETKEMLDGIK
jgi:hypothetical protein